MISKNESHKSKYLTKRVGGVTLFKRISKSSYTMQICRKYLSCCPEKTFALFTNLSGKSQALYLVN